MPFCRATFSFSNNERASGSFDSTPSSANGVTPLRLSAATSTAAITIISTSILRTHCIFIQLLLLHHPSWKQPIPQHPALRHQTALRHRTGIAHPHCSTQQPPTNLLTQAPCAPYHTSMTGEEYSVRYQTLVRSTRCLAHPCMTLEGLRPGAAPHPSKCCHSARLPTRIYRFSNRSRPMVLAGRAA